MCMCTKNLYIQISWVWLGGVSHLFFRKIGKKEFQLSFFFIDRWNFSNEIPKIRLQIEWVWKADYIQSSFCMRHPHTLSIWFVRFTYTKFVSNDMNRPCFPSVVWRWSELKHNSLAVESFFCKKKINNLIFILQTKMTRFGFLTIITVVLAVSLHQG